MSRCFSYILPTTVYARPPVISSAMRTDTPLILFIYLFILFSFLLVFFLRFCLVVAVELSLDRVTLVIIGVELPFLVPTWPFFSSFFFVFFYYYYLYRRWWGKKQKPSSVSVDGGCSFNELVGGFRSNQKGRAVGRLTDCVPSQSKGTITNGRPLNQRAQLNDKSSPHIYTVASRISTCQLALALVLLLLLLRFVNHSCKDRKPTQPSTCAASVQSIRHASLREPSSTPAVSQYTFPPDNKTHPTWLLIIVGWLLPSRFSFFLSL